MNRKQRRQQGRKGGALRMESGRRSPAGTDINAVMVDAVALHKSGQLDRAEAVYNHILSQFPDHPRCLHLMGLIAHQRGNSEKAVELIRRSVTVDGSDAEAHNNLGNALRRLGHVDEAVLSFRKAVEIMPEFAGAYSNLGLTLRQLGDFRGAAVEFREALRRAPGLAEAWSGLARTGRLTFNEHEARQAEEVLVQGNLTRADRRHLRFALGKHYDDSGLWDQAFLHFKAANDLREVTANADRPVALMNAMRKSFTNHSVSALPKLTPEPSDPVPVFIFGMPRSGTTLVEQILASHPDVEAGGELNIVEATLTRIFSCLRDGRAPGPEEITAASLKDLRQQFFGCFSSAAPGKRFLTDKSPFNFIYLPILGRAFPDARFIHCRRDPLDTCLSIYFTDFRQDRAFTTDLGAIGAFHSAYRDTAECWQHLKFPEICEFSYESVLENQEKETRHLLRNCGLSWNSACLNFFETKRQVATPSDWQVRMPVFSTSRGRWRHYEGFLAPLIKALE